MTAIHLPFSGGQPEPTAACGFRLDRFELYNWGTFHDRVWSIDLRSRNVLVTGDIGSGKSTLVDALTTLLVAPQKIAYNKAAGADLRERSLRSYVAGHYKSERNETGMAAKPVALRDRNAYSVILARFYAADLDQTVTLAQVFWQRDPSGPPERLYALADVELSIAKDFTGFDGDTRVLRKRLRAAGIDVHDSFASYAAAYRRRLGIAGEQAMDLFHQTVSMKSVGNLTDFVREHMLEACEVGPRIDALIGHFDDLDRAHQAVVIAKNQIAHLTPLVANCDEHKSLLAESEHMRSCRQALGAWFALLKADLLRVRLAQLSADIERQDRHISGLEGNRRECDRSRDELRQAIADNGGIRIEQLTHEIDRLIEQQKDREQRAELYERSAVALGIVMPSDEDQFESNREFLRSEGVALEGARIQEQSDATDAAVAEREALHALTIVGDELESLRKRRTNIPKSMLDLRTRLCIAIDCSDEMIPFAGELIAVLPGATLWEGAAERVLHSFGLSLLVSEELYEQAADWVNRTHLAGRLVYFRVKMRADTFGTYVAQMPDADSLVRKLAIAPHSPFYTWLEMELSRRFNFICCDDLERFRREPRAITRTGHLKTSNERHEKDDRRRIDDRTQYILGWSNETKIAALEKQASELAAQLQAYTQNSARIEERRKRTRERAGAVDKLSTAAYFRDIDWRSLSASRQLLEDERRALLEGADMLRTLQTRLQQTEQQIIRIDVDLTKRQREQSGLEQRFADYDGVLDTCDGVLRVIPDDVKLAYFPALAAMRDEALGVHTLTVETCDGRERDIRDWLQAKIDAVAKRGERLRDAIVKSMQEYRGLYPAEARELDAAVDAAEEYRRALERLLSDDLPRFETRFKELLNENAVREIANFQSQLNRELQNMSDRIESINTSLREIDFNPERYIILEAEPARDGEIQDFRRDLRACTEGTLTGSTDQSYTEAKFLQVKRIIERFRGREGKSELDRRWSRKVSDVRTWQIFSASERWRADNHEHEHYTDSGGKSGGQKEKLAYTILAASIAYQFGVERGNSRSFRFVAIDEAFGRGSDESARYGLELFKRLDLQLLIVTPLQKIHVIEPFVSAVAFVQNDGQYSRLHNLTVEAYQAERSARER